MDTTVQDMKEVTTIIFTTETTGTSKVMVITRTIITTPIIINVVEI